MAELLNNNLQEYIEAGLAPEEIEEIQSYTYDDYGCDKAIERIKSVNEDIDRFKEIAKAHKEEIDKRLEKQITKLEKKKQWDLFQLASIVDNDPNAKETKTQRKLTFLSGEVVRKKPTQKMIKPDWTEDQIKQFVDKEFHKVKTELNWAELKKTLKLDKGKVYNEDGEIFENIEVVDVPAQTIVK